MSTNRSSSNSRLVPPTSCPSPPLPQTYGEEATARLDRWLGRQNLCLKDIMVPVEQMSDNAKNFWRGYSTDVEMLVWPFHAKQVSRFAHMDRKNPDTGENFSLGESAYDFDKDCFKPEAIKKYQMQSGGSAKHQNCELVLTHDLIP